MQLYRLKDFTRILEQTGEDDALVIVCNQTLTDVLVEIANHFLSSRITWVPETAQVDSFMSLGLFDVDGMVQVFVDYETDHQPIVDALMKYKNKLPLYLANRLIIQRLWTDEDEINHLTDQAVSRSVCLFQNTYVAKEPSYLPNRFLTEACKYPAFKEKLLDYLIKGEPLVTKQEPLQALVVDIQDETKPILEKLVFNYHKQ